DGLSKVIVITVNGSRQRALGQIDYVPIAIQNLLVPMKLQVIESPEETLLLETDFFEKTQAQWDFADKTLKLLYNGDETVVQTTHTYNDPLYIESDEEEYNDNDAQQELEYELESDLSENETYHSELSDQLDEEGLYSNPWQTETPDDENPVLYLTETASENKPPFQIGVLDKKQEQTVDRLFTEYLDVFAKNISEKGQTIELGQTHVVEHTIDTKDAAPIKQRAYRIASSNQEFIQKEIQTMFEKGLIRESSSPWASPIVLVPKKNGKQRICIDYRKLNHVTEKDVYPLPVIDDILESFKGAQWFSTLDLASGYWQVAVKEEDKKKTAFITKYGLYEFNVMPFGLCNAPATFQRLIDKLMKKYLGKFVLAYLDDLTIYSKTFDEHVKHLAIVFQVLREAQLKLNKEKCHFFLHSITFLGHEISWQEIQPDEEKLIKVKNFPQPTNLRT